MDRICAHLIKRQMPDRNGDRQRGSNGQRCWVKVAAYPKLKKDSEKLREAKGSH